MAFSFLASNSQRITTSAPINTLPLSIACWFRSTTISAATLPIIQIGLNTGSYWRLVIPSNTRILRANQSGFPADTAADTIITNQWMHGGAVFTSSASRTVYLSGTSPVTSVTSAPTPTGVTSMQIGSLETSAYWNGDIAEVGIWNTSLTAAEFTSLQQGCSCALVRPQSLVFYAPLMRDLIDIRRGLTLTNNNGALVSAHPRIYL
jgi:hypothetical protein